MNNPPFLKNGDKIAIICPASKVSADLTPAYKMLESWGLEPVIYPSVKAHSHQFAGSDELRIRDFQDALDNPEIKAIIAARGGYGCVRILDQVNYDKFSKNPKWIIGFSDLTAIHSHIQSNFQIPTIHGQMVKSMLNASQESLQTLKNALFGQNVDISYTHESYPHRPGSTSGILIGGNLAILHSMLSSCSDINFEDKILFIEDVGESHYNIDRMLWSLKRAGKFKGLKGLIIGGFTDFRDTEAVFGQRFEDIIMDKVCEFDYPVAFGFPAGHIRDNRALILGKTIQLNIKEQQVSLSYI